MIAMTRQLILALSALLLVPGSSLAQAPDSAAEKRPLQIEDYARWRSVSGSAISPDGEWVAWSYGRIRGDDTLTVRAVTGSDTRSVPFGTGPLFSDDGRWVAYAIGHSFRESEASDGDLPNSAGLMELATGETWSWADADDFGFAPGSSHFWVKKTASDDDAEHAGTDLLLRTLSSGAVELLGSVDELDFDDDGRWLAWTVDAGDHAGNGLYVMDLESGVRQPLDQAETRYSRLTWAGETDAVAVLRGSTPDDMEERENTLVAVTELGSSSPRVTAFQASDGLPEGWVLSENAGLDWNDAGTIVFAGARAQSATPEEPLEVLRTVHSFDPCLACAIHTLDVEGNEIARVKAL